MLPFVARIRLLQGRLLGQMDSLGFDLPLEICLEALTLEVIKTSEIEGKYLNSSVARHLGIEGLYQHQLVTPSYEVEVNVEMMLKATSGFDLPLTLDEVCRWHHALFPQGLSGMYGINVDALQDDANGLMQVVSDAFGKTKMHFQAPKADRLPEELAWFFQWYNDDNTPLDLTIKAGLAHL
ncbi:DUF4172 domain-containing protein [Moraxella marmotae]|uniref:DUF4172 domain-containing protein n=1 Tax=Moraxella marmotae TaxID=3344520 RepID=UPI0035F45E9F